MEDYRGVRGYRRGTRGPSTAFGSRFTSLRMTLVGRGWRKIPTLPQSARKDGAPKNRCLHDRYRAEAFWTTGHWTRPRFTLTKCQLRSNPMKLARIVVSFLVALPAAYVTTMRFRDGKRLLQTGGIDNRVDVYPRRRSRSLPAAVLWHRAGSTQAYKLVLTEPIGNKGGLY